MLPIRRLRAHRRLAAACGGLALILSLAVGVPALAEETPITVEPLTGRATFTDDASGQIRVKMPGHGTNVLNMKDLSRTVVAEITVQPGAQFPWHTHPGPVIVNVARGELVYVMASDCVHRPYPAGTAFVDPGRGHVHSAYNPTDDATVVIATFFEATESGPLTITDGVEPPDNCEL